MALNVNTHGSPARRFIKKTLPASLVLWVRDRLARSRGSVGVHYIDWGDFRRLTPLSSIFGYDRGRPIDRYYIEGFLEQHRSDVKGIVLEVDDSRYTERFGGDRVTLSEVLHVIEGAPYATIIANLEDAPAIPSESFDCVIITQTLHLIYETRRAIETVRRILKPGGVVLATVPGISPIDRAEWRDSWHYNFTACSAQRMFNESFGAEHVSVTTHGNVLSAMSFLQGVAAEELTSGELDYVDDVFPVTVAIRAVKPNR